jgi:hypothetical protein
MKYNNNHQKVPVPSRPHRSNGSGHFHKASTSHVHLNALTSLQPLPSLVACMELELHQQHTSSQPPPSLALLPNPLASLQNLLPISGKVARASKAQPLIWRPLVITTSCQ